MKHIKTKMTIFIISVLMMTLLSGCSSMLAKEEGSTENSNSSENVILTETGEVIEREESAELTLPAPEPIPTPTAAEEPLVVTPFVEPEHIEAGEAIKPSIELTEPEQQQVISEEDQVEPGSGKMQLVFLGDSIFDNNRDGSGVPYLTSVQCEADVYNLAIGGTSATIEWDEQTGYEDWTSRGLCGVVNAIMRVIPTDIFEGTRAKEILDNPRIDFTQTDYFIIEYGLNDYFRAVPLSIGDATYDLRSYVGALRYAVANLRRLAPDATIILCSPTYAQFYNSEGYLVGEGNMTNTGYGTLFDYKGICNYVANEQQTLFLNAYQDLNIDSYTADEYLEDGIHLTSKGRQEYADALAKIILNYEKTKNN